MSRGSALPWSHGHCPSAFNCLHMYFHDNSTISLFPCISGAASQYLSTSGMSCGYPGRAEMGIYSSTTRQQSRVWVKVHIPSSLWPLIYLWEVTGTLMRLPRRLTSTRLSRDAFRRWVKYKLVHKNVKSYSIICSFPVGALIIRADPIQQTRTSYRLAYARPIHAVEGPLR